MRIFVCLAIACGSAAPPIEEAPRPEPAVEAIAPVASPLLRLEIRNGVIEPSRHDGESRYLVAGHRAEVRGDEIVIADEILPTWITDVRRCGDGFLFQEAHDQALYYAREFAGPIVN